MSRTAAIQDLRFYKTDSLFSNDNDIPSAAAAAAVTLVSSTYEVEPTWLVSVLLSRVLSQTAAAGSTGRSNKASSKQGISTEEPDHVVLVSFVDKSTVYERALSKLGIDVQRLRRKVYFNAGNNTNTTNSSSRNTNNTNNTLLPFTQINISGTLTNDLTPLTQFLQTTITSPPPRTLILFESIDMLVALGHSAQQVLDLATVVQSLSRNAFFFVNADPELLGQQQQGNLHEPFAAAAPGTTLEAVQTATLLGLMYRSKLVLAVRPLRTGRAKDVTGTLSISRGPLCTDDSVVEDSYQYFVSGDTVRLFYR